MKHVSLSEVRDYVVSLKDFYHKASNIEVPCRSDLFEPDHWTRTLAEGLQKVNLSGKNVLEVGIGVGINMAGLMTAKNPPASFIGGDIREDAIKLSQALAKKYSLPAICQYSDLLLNISQENLEIIDQIFACIPQVPACLDLNENDNAAHYYRPDGNSWDDYGLGLNAKLLKQATERAPQAGIILNFSGRPGEKTLKTLFNECGRIPNILHESIVPQHKGTSLASLAEMEGNGHSNFEFFSDPKAKIQISASDAEDRRIKNQPVFHKIYVMNAPGLTL